MGAYRVNQFSQGIIDRLIEQGATMERDIAANPPGGEKAALRERLAKIKREIADRIDLFIPVLEKLDAEVAWRMISGRFLPPAFIEELKLMREEAKDQNPAAGLELIAALMELMHLVKIRVWLMLRNEGRLCPRDEEDAEKKQTRIARKWKNRQPRHVSQTEDEDPADERLTGEVYEGHLTHPLEYPWREEEIADFLEPEEDEATLALVERMTEGLPEYMKRLLWKIDREASTGREDSSMLSP